MRSTIDCRLRDWFSVGRCSSSRVAVTAPHFECPSTTTSRVPNCEAANSTLPTSDGATMLPATRITKRSPSPWSKISSAGTRASEQPRMMASGSCSDGSSGRLVWLTMVSGPRTFEANRALPFRRRSSASRPETIRDPPESYTVR